MYSTKCQALKCDVCGRFISYEDIESGAAVHKITSPDSALSSESYETICQRCRATEKRMENHA